MEEISYEPPSDAQIREYARFWGTPYDRYTLGETCVHYWVGQSRAIVDYFAIHEFFKEDE